MRSTSTTTAATDRELPFCEVIPLPHREFAFRIDGREVTRWHASHDAPRPYFYPLLGSAGESLTRMGHPGAPNHDHHRSFWFAHHDMLGIDFWSEDTVARIRQKQWYAIEDGNGRACLAVGLEWVDGHDPTPLLLQNTFFTLRPLPNWLGTGFALELQVDLKAQAEGIEFRKSNFGLLGLRVAKSLSVVFGRGKITGADGRIGEKQLFGQPNRWIDYSGPVSLAPNENRIAGMTLIDHPHNPGHGKDNWASWHVREDGWIGPSISRHDAVAIPTESTLTCRYTLVVHDGPMPPELDRYADEFDQRPRLSLIERPKPHHQYGIATVQ